jgi:hypothetical protein
MTLHWLAGILEGEGSFLAGPPSEPRCPAIRLPMTDRDTVVRVSELFRRAVVATRPRQAHHKVAYVTTIKGAPAARMMRAIAPLMSPRRRAQIERALRDRHARVGTQTRSRAAEQLITDGAELSWEATDADARIAWLAGDPGRGRVVRHFSVRRSLLPASPNDHVRSVCTRARDDPHAGESHL